jgi:formate dehydrogenase subunit gamma
LGVVVAGTIVSITGLLLEFPNFGLSAAMMKLSSTLHLISALGWTLITLGHVVLGTLAVEGAFEGMINGRVDVKYARQHHEVWADELMQMGIAPQSSQALEESSDDP